MPASGSAARKAARRVARRSVRPSPRRRPELAIPVIQSPIPARKLSKWNCPSGSASENVQHGRGRDLRSGDLLAGSGQDVLGPGDGSPPPGQPAAGRGAAGVPDPGGHPRSGSMRQRVRDTSGTTGQRAACPVWTASSLRYATRSQGWSLPEAMPPRERRRLDVVLTRPESRGGQARGSRAIARRTRTAGRRR